MEQSHNQVIVDEVKTYRAELQGRYLALEKKLESANNALAQSKIQTGNLERDVTELTEKWREDVKLKEQAQQKVGDLSKKMKVWLQLVDNTEEQQE